MGKSDLKSAKRFGTRYGKAVKAKVAKFEAMQRADHKCPSCRKEKAKRVAVGIFSCKGCGAKFTAKAYTIAQ